MRFSRVRHRVSQFARTLAGSLLPVDMQYVAAQLPSEELLELFASMPRVEQHHGVAICRVLERQGFHDGDLLAAALLHDVGKTVSPLHLWERVFVVLMERFVPHLATTWADVSADGPVPAGLRHGFAVRRHHPVWGADLAARSGASSRTVAWIRQHHDSGDVDDPLLAALLDADEA